VKQAEEKYKIREISYLFQTLEKEWERSGRTVTKRKLDQDALDIFSEYYVRRVKEYEKEQDNIKTKTIQKMVKEIKEMSILLRIAKKICTKSKTLGKRKNMRLISRKVSETSSISQLHFQAATRALKKLFPKRLPSHRMKMS